MWIEQWIVTKESDGTQYTVSKRHNGEWACSCMAWTRQRRECKHIKFCNGRYSRLPGYSKEMVAEIVSQSINVIKVMDALELREIATPIPTALELIRKNAVYGGI